MGPCLFAQEWSGPSSFFSRFWLHNSFEPNLLTSAAFPGPAEFIQHSGRHGADGMDPLHQQNTILQSLQQALSPAHEQVIQQQVSSALALCCMILPSASYDPVEAIKPQDGLTMLEGPKASVDLHCACCRQGGGTNAGGIFVLCWSWS